MAGLRQLDSAILIRTADIGPGGRLRLGVGATLVRHSHPDAEVGETRAKAATVLAAAGLADFSPPPRPAPAAASSARSSALPASAPAAGRRDGPPDGAGAFGRSPVVRAALARRNTALASFWFAPAGERQCPVPSLAGRRIMVVDAEDAFTGMLGHQLRALGPEVRIEPWRELRSRPELLGSADVVVLGPGPGDPASLTDPRILTMRSLAGRLLAQSAPFVSVCLSHQVLAGLLGLPLVRKAVPSQGLQREIDLLGRRCLVGFYNTFTAVAADELADPRGGTVRVSRDPDTGHVDALHGSGFASVQFHPESVLTRDGPGILTGLLDWVTTPRRASAAA